MKYYARIIDGKLDSVGQVPIKESENVFSIKISEEIAMNIEKYVYQNGEIVDISNTPEYLNERKRQENEARAIVIKEEMKNLDEKSIRCIRSIQYGFLNEQQIEKEKSVLEEIENQIQNLRAEFSQLA